MQRLSSHVTEVYDLTPGLKFLVAKIVNYLLATSKLECRLQLAALSMRALYVVIMIMNIESIFDPSH